MPVENQVSLGGKRNHYFTLGLLSSAFCWQHCFLPYSLLTGEKITGAQQTKLLKTCSALGVTPQPLGPPPLLFSVASLSPAWCHVFKNCWTFRGSVRLPVFVSTARGGSGPGHAPSTEGNEIPQYRYQVLPVTPPSASSKAFSKA